MLVIHQSICFYSTILYKLISKYLYFELQNYGYRLKPGGQIVKILGQIVKKRDKR